MKSGEESRTAIMVCVARAVAHGRTRVPRFEDPTALALLPEEARASVTSVREGRPAKNWREALQRRFIEVRATMMALRTVAVDDAVRLAAHPQVVILGAGLDGRAWRMPELEGVNVYEVDHPDSQQRKRERSKPLEAPAADIRFVPVDFERDSLEAALTLAGHDPTRPTTWIWEGVVMYLERPAIEATLTVVERRSAAKSTLAVVYNARSLAALLLSGWLRRVGEPFRSSFEPPQLRALLARYGFAIDTDESIPQIAERLAPQEARAMKRIRHARVAIATRRTVAA